MGIRMRNNLRPPAEPFASGLANNELLKARALQTRLEQQLSAPFVPDADESPRKMPASTLALAGGISLLAWGLLAWIIGS